MQEKFRILSLDGGGARGYLSATILANIETLITANSSDFKPLGQHFDLIAGTSTGAILAAGLAAGVSASEMLAMYQESLAAVFKRRWHRPVGFFSPLYDAGRLRKALNKTLGNRSLSDVETDLCIVSVALQTGQPRLYKSDYLDRNTPRITDRLVDIALASAAAPVYFPPADGLEKSGLLVDGGLCANNPSMIAVIDALQFERPSKSRQTTAPDRSMQNIILLSVGTGRRPGLPYDATRLKKAGILKWVRPNLLRAWTTSEPPAIPLLELILESQSRLTERQVAFLLGKENYLRINPELGRSYPLDDTRHLEELLNYADINQASHEWLKSHFPEAME